MALAWKFVMRRLTRPQPLACAVAIIFFCFHSANAQDTKVMLSDTVITALEYSPQLDVLQNNESAITHERDRAYGGYYPAVDLTFGYGAEAHSDEFTRSEQSGDIDHNFYDRLEASIRLSQLIYDGKETKSLVGIEDAKLDSAGFRTFDNAEAIALDAIIAHFEVNRQRQLVALAEQNVQDHQNILGDLQERQEGGAGSIADVDQTQARLARAFASLAETEGGLRAAEANYMRIVGKLPGDLENYFVPKEFVPTSLESAIQATLQNNPKIKALGANVVEAEQRVELSRSSFLPKAYAELSSSYEDQVESSETYEQNNQAMLRLRWNLFNGGSDIADRKASSARKMQAIASRKDQMDVVVEETRATWAELDASRKQVVAFGDAVTYNQKTLDSYIKQFNVGQRTLLDVLDARNELFQSSGLLVTAQANEVIAIERLLALSGQLTKSLQIDEHIYMVQQESN
ncbi:MAG: TolC family outer membrane protein [Deltaproteobacteria bacterium]|jgi:adhesin transport system outer membrane protein|nr:TolC family outer membrane protein [Deltaproteobacteria bacterium]